MRAFSDKRGFRTASVLVTLVALLAVIVVPRAVGGAVEPPVTLPDETPKAESQEKTEPTREPRPCSGEGALTAQQKEKRPPEACLLPPDTPEDGLLSVSPDRWLGNVDPGSSTTFQLTVTNKTGSDATVVFTPTDLEPADEPERLSDIVENSKYGAGDWIRPEIKRTKMPNLGELTIDVTIKAPEDAPVGSNFGGVLVQLEPTEARSSDGSVQVKTKAQALVQAYPTVNGPVIRDLVITSVKPDNSYKFLGNRFVRYEVTYENRGTVNEAVGGTLGIRSMFGNEVERLDIPELLVLRGAKRRARLLWNDPPRFGRFSATARVETTDGQKSKDAPTVTILPPWWVVLAIALTILFGILYTWRRRSQDWRRYLDDEEWDDEDWDDDPVDQP